MTGRWQRTLYRQASQVQGLLRVLMKPRNGEAWTKEDKDYLRGELRALARWAPAFCLFLLPGSVLWLPIYAWYLDQRRSRVQSGAGGRRDADDAPPASAPVQKS